MNPRESQSRMRIVRALAWTGVQVGITGSGGLDEK